MNSQRGKILEMSSPIKASSAIASQPGTNPKDLTEPGKELLPEIEVALVEQGIKQQHSPHRVHFTAALLRESTKERSLLL